jgi:spore coat protein U-like protein
MACAAVLAVLAVVPVAAQQSRTAKLEVLAEVVADCNITVAPLAFGNYDPIEAHRTTPLDGATIITLTCTRGTIASITMDDGRHAQGGGQRAMAGPNGSMLRYELFREATRSSRWGSAGAGVNLPASPSLGVRSYTVYGRVPASQDVPVGSYVDEVIVNVSF